MSGRDTIGYDLVKYGETKGHPFRTDAEWYTICQLAGNVRGETILDAGSGEGVYTRALVKAGAGRVIALDGDKKGIETSINLARKEGLLDKISHRAEWLQETQGDQNCHQAVGSYVMSYPKNLQEATRYARGLASHLMSGGRFVGFNNNPFDVFDGIHLGEEHGFEKEMHGGDEGGEVIYRVWTPDKSIVEIHNVYLSPDTYEKALEGAGFRDIKWHGVQLDPNTRQSPEYWNKFFAGGTKEFPSPFIAMTAVKR